MIETHHPKTELEWLNLRAGDITSTEVSALFGVSPYCTLFELWHRKKNREVVTIEQNERMTWGVRLQDAIAHGIATDHGYAVRPMKEYLRDPELRIGASYDYAIEGIHRPEGFVEKKGLLEIKNVDALMFRDGWLITDDPEGELSAGSGIEAPPHIEFQVQHQLLLDPVREFTFIGALVGGNRVEMLHRQPDPEVHAAIRARVREFNKSLDENRPPKPNFHEDVDLICKLYGYSTKGKVFDARGDDRFLALAQEYEHEKELAKAADSARLAAKAEMLTLVGDAEKVIGDGWSVSASAVGSASVSYTREGYRGFRLYWKKEKAGR